MKKLFAKIAITVAGITGVAVAQQDPQFTQWMHNKIIYNPGYAGTSGAICGNLQFRQQWANFDGAPTSIAVGADMRVSPEVPVGVGLTIINDKIGPMSTNFARLSGSYLLKISNGNLGLGLDVGILQKSISAEWIVPEPGKIDNSIPGAYGSAINNPELGKLTYDLGFGAFYQIPGKFYVGLSSTHLPAQSVIEKDNVKYDLTRHYYLMAGYTHVVGWHEFTPQVKYKSDLAAGAFDANFTYGYRINNDQKVSLGATYRMGDAAAVLLGYQHPFGQGYTAKIGYSYDFILSKIKGYSSGTHEIVLGVCYTPKLKKVTSYGDDRFLN
jgi:type IX secretion system PorP/SprF family membrane protein